jgi:hypothetical protein
MALPLSCNSLGKFVRERDYIERFRVIAPSP